MQYGKFLAFDLLQLIQPTITHKNISRANLADACHFEFFFANLGDQALAIAFIQNIADGFHSNIIIRHAANRINRTGKFIIGTGTHRGHIESIAFSGFNILIDFGFILISR